MTALATGFVSTPDGIDLYWRSIGDGPPIVCCNGVGVSTFFWKYVAAHFAKHHRIVLWDYRGHGRSAVPRPAEDADLSIETTAQDLFLVMDAAGVSDPAAIIGHSMGCQVALEAHHQAPERVAALIPMFGTFARPLDTFMDFPGSRAAFDVLKQLARAGGRMSQRVMQPLFASPLAFPFGQATGLVDPYYAGRHDIEQYIEHMAQMDLGVFLRMVELMADHDLTDHLPHVRVPTLVFGAEHDLFTPLHRSKYMAEHIPEAELMVVADGSHAALVEHPATINRRIGRFFRERVPSHASDET